MGQTFSQRPTYSPISKKGALQRFYPALQTTWNAAGLGSQETASNSLFCFNFRAVPWHLEKRDEHETLDFKRTSNNSCRNCKNIVNFGASSKANRSADVMNESFLTAQILSRKIGDVVQHLAEIVETRAKRMPEEAKIRMADVYTSVFFLPFGGFRGLWSGFFI